MRWSSGKKAVWLFVLAFFRWHSFRIIDENAEMVQQQQGGQQQPSQQPQQQLQQPSSSAQQMQIVGQADRPVQPLAPEGNSQLFYRIKLKMWERCTHTHIVHPPVGKKEILRRAVWHFSLLGSKFDAWHVCEILHKFNCQRLHVRFALPCSWSWGEA
jgi:hypothetical protein